jgi:hypothetical protein
MITGAFTLTTLDTRLIRLTMILLTALGIVDLTLLGGHAVIALAVLEATSGELSLVGLGLDGLFGHFLVFQLAFAVTLATFLVTAGIGFFFVVFDATESSDSTVGIDDSGGCSGRSSDGFRRSFSYGRNECELELVQSEIGMCATSLEYKTGKDGSNRCLASLAGKQ